ncbi:MAG TPA: DUF481 domain-containing protein [Edaphobacter sp.]|nr:DUF481 domain-containing protein [Edaphobacter sp.]
MKRDLVLETAPLRLAYRTPLFCKLMLAGLVAMFFPLTLSAQDKAAAPSADVVIFNNGDQLTGKLERGVGDSIVFKSDAVGEVTIPMSKVKELKSSSNFVVLRKDEKVTSTPKQAEAVAVQNGAVIQTTPSGNTETTAAKDVGYIVDGTTYNRELNGHPGFFRGWDGAVTGGATVLQSTSYGQTYTAALNLFRDIPSVAYLPPRTRTTFNLLETYGKLTQPVVPNPGNLPASEAKTSIFHTDFEHDKYFGPRFYVLGNLSYDHNFAQGLNFQQIYGGGAGYTVLKTAVQQFDVKGDLHYEQQKFIQPVQPTPPAAQLPLTPDQNLIGSTFGEAYKRALPGKIQLTHSGTYIQSWNNTNAWSAVGSLGLALPVYHRFSLSVNLLDNYLNNPALGYNKNSLQFVTGVTYNFH